MFEVPNPVRLLSLVQVYRILLKKLPRTTMIVKKVEYQRCFTGFDLHKTLQDWLHLSLKKAKDFGEQLLEKEVITCLCWQQSCSTTNANIYGLRALESPQILNLGCPPLKRSDAASNRSSLEILLSLCQVLEKVFDEYATEHDMVQSVTYHYFDEAVAGLQRMQLPENDPLFLTNIYNLMVRHALIEWNQGHWQSLLGQIQYQFADGMVVTLADISAHLSAPAKRRSKLSCLACV
jgi:hypothetical protein